ncbi:MAG: transposase [Pseudomonadota bacterium]
MKRVQGIRKKYRKKARVIKIDEYEGLKLDSRLELIEQLIPLGLMKVQEELQEEVRQLAGERYSRGDYVRYGTNPGSVVLGGQRIGIGVPRVRDKRMKSETVLKSYSRLHNGAHSMEEMAMNRILKGISCRDYESAAMAVPEAFGLSSSSVSRQFVKVSQEKLRELQERDLSCYDFVAMWIDGKTFSKNDLIVAVGLTIEGCKIILGFIETATENNHVTIDFLNELLKRGMSIEEGILVIVDGSKGLNSGIKRAFKGKSLIQRCQWHKRENVVDYLSKEEQPLVRRQLQRAYERPTYSEAKASLLKIRNDLEKRNLSAVRSLDEGFEETLTLHRLGLFTKLGRSLKTTNCIESINAMIEQRCGKVDYWQNSSQRQRWLAATLLDVEPRLNRISGYRHLHELRMALKNELKLNRKIADEAA